MGQNAGRRHDGNPRLFRQLAGRNLRAQQAHDRGFRADEGDAGRRAGLGELGILGKKAIAWMHGVNLRLPRHADDVLDVEIGLHRFLARADAIGFVRLEAMQGKPILMREHADRTNTQLARRAHDTNGDLAAIRHQKLSETTPFTAAHDTLAITFVPS